MQTHATSPTSPKFTLNNVRQALRTPLPGWLAQREMAPPHRDMVISQEILDRARPSSVLVLVYPKHNVLHVVLTLRASTLNKHKGQISLPGGSCDPEDADFSATALREANEELGVSPNGLEVLGALSSMYVPPSNFLIHPIVALAATGPQFTPNPSEVAAIIEAPITDLIDPSLRSIQIRPSGMFNGQMIDVPTLYMGGHYVWGATAMILAEFGWLLRTVGA